MVLTFIIYFTGVYFDGAHNQKGAAGLYIIVHKNAEVKDNEQATYKRDEEEESPIPSTLITNLLNIDEETGEYDNSLHFNVLCSKSGSMQQNIIPAWGRHFLSVSCLPLLIRNFSRTRIRICSIILSNVIIFASHYEQALPERKDIMKEQVILFLDQHLLRDSYPFFKMMWENNVFIVILPSKTSMWTQPNDCGINASKKANESKAMTAFRWANPTDVPSKGDFMAFLKMCWRDHIDTEHMEMITMGSNDVASRGFERTGI